MSGGHHQHQRQRCLARWHPERLGRSRRKRLLCPRKGQAGGRVYTARLADCRSELIPNAQHRAPEENPIAFLAAVERFLSEVDAPLMAEIPR